MSSKCFFILAIVSFLILGCGETGESSIFLLPKNYQGVIFVLYNQAKGALPKYDNGNRIYEIPSEGILKTQFKPNKGWHSIDKYYYIDKGKRVEIPYEQQPKSVEGDSIKVCCFSSGTSGNPNASQVEFLMFYIGTEKNLDSIYERGEKINPIDLIK